MQKVKVTIDRTNWHDPTFIGVRHPIGSESWTEASKHSYRQCLDKVRSEYGNFWSSIYIPSYSSIFVADTPAHIATMSQELSYQMAQMGFILRTMSNSNASLASINGVDRLCLEMEPFGIDLNVSSRLKEVFVPWPGFDGVDTELNDVPVQAMYLAENYTFDWEKLSGPQRKLAACRILTLLGYNMNHPSLMLLTWTPDRAEKLSEVSPKTGILGPLIMMADAANIPVFNLGRTDSISRIARFAAEVSSQTYKTDNGIDQCLEALNQVAQQTTSHQSEDSDHSVSAELFGGA